MWCCLKTIWFAFQPTAAESHQLAYNRHVGHSRMETPVLCTKAAVNCKSPGMPESYFATTVSIGQQPMVISSSLCNFYRILSEQRFLLSWLLFPVAVFCCCCCFFLPCLNCLTCTRWSTWWIGFSFNPKVSMSFEPSVCKFTV